MLIYSLEISARLQYIVEFIGKELLLPFTKITTDVSEFRAYHGPKINYSPEKVADNEFWICSVDLLFEKSIKTQYINCFEGNKYKAFFQALTGDFSFDVLAASFYLLSRYEEYLPHKEDKFGRYAHTESLACKNGFLHLPLVNIWLTDLKKSLLSKYRNLQSGTQSFTFLPTYDIDIAWSYRNKGWWRNTGGLLKSAVKKDWYAVKDRLGVLIKSKKDPFDAYELLNGIHKKMQAKPIYFFLLASRQKGHDKNISPVKNQLKQLIKEHAQLYSVGIHPSWRSGDNEKQLGSEIHQLEEWVNHKVIHSRQHYLRFSLPLTYQKLIHHGIEKDYSMGYGTVNGFRASVASSFYWYDLEQETKTNLELYPFCFMDANAYYELKMSPKEALAQMILFYNIIKDVNGLMITLWHNNFLGTDPAFAGWRETYELFLATTITAGNIR